jgi:hypothetical protein
MKASDCSAFVSQVTSLVDQATNELVFLPTGLGQMEAVNRIIENSLDRSDFCRKHVIFCAVRPGQVLSHARQLRWHLGNSVQVGAYCGGDFLYDFEKEFADKDVLVFTAGLLMRIVKLGVYTLNRCQLLILHDAFYTIRNHPMNTLVREYYWNIPAEQRPKILGTMLPQLHSLNRPFDKLRRSIRKLSHSLQAGIVLPAGHALEEMTARIYRPRLIFQSYVIFAEERELLLATVKHILEMWDVLYRYKLNPFGRLIHFPMNDDNVMVDPCNHDWEQMELIVSHSIEHCDSRVGKLIMKHVQVCVSSAMTTISAGYERASRTLKLEIEHFLGSMVDIVDTNEAEAEIVRQAQETASSSLLAGALMSTGFQRSLDHFRYSESSRRKLFCAIMGSLDVLQNLVCVVTRDQQEADELKNLCNESSISQLDNMQIFSNDGDHEQTVGVLFITEMSLLLGGPVRLMIRQQCSDVIWFSSWSVIHAAGFDMDSNALTIMRQMCGVGKGEESGPQCHVLATAGQSLQWLEILKADQKLLAAAEFVQSGDASLEEGLILLDQENQQMLQEQLLPSPSSLLHMLCCGLCGVPPSFYLFATSEMCCKSEVTLDFPELGEVHFHAQAVSPQEARDLSAIKALSFLKSRGFVAKYWETSILEKDIDRRGLDQPQSTPYGSYVPAAPPVAPAGATGTVTERMICNVCGIATTSGAHLIEHQNGRRHRKNVERLRRQLATDNVAQKRVPTSLSCEVQEEHHPSKIKTVTETLPSSISDVIRHPTQESAMPGLESEPLSVRTEDWVLPSTLSMSLSSIIDDAQLHEVFNGEASGRITEEGNHGRAPQSARGGYSL